jgi:Ricin-type beta-trefoil lectin domain
MSCNRTRPTGLWLALCLNLLASVTTINAQPLSEATVVSDVFSLQDLLGRCIGMAKQGPSFARQLMPQDCTELSTSIRQTNTFNLINQDLCLGINAANPEPGYWPGGAVVWSGCGGTVNQFWQINSRPENKVELVNVMTGHCLTVTSAEKYANTLQMKPCKQLGNQLWTIVRKKKPTR